MQGIKNGRIETNSKMQLLWDLELSYLGKNNLVKNKKKADLWEPGGS